MSLECNGFLNENGITGFLGGIVSASSDEFSIQIYNLGIRYETLDADIFYLGEHNEITFEDAIKKRMKSYWYDASTIGDTTDINKLIDLAQFKLRKSNETKLSETITKMYTYIEDADLKKINTLAKEFDDSIKYYLQKPKAIYDLPIEVNGDIYECGSIISRCYTYIIFSIVLVEYDKYVLLLVRGSNE